MSSVNQASVVETLANIVGASACVTGEEAVPYATDWRRRYFGAALCVVKPSSTDEVAQVVRSCAEAGVPIVPQGGNTGLCGGATPDAAGRAVILNLSRMNR